MAVRALGWLSANDFTLAHLELAESLVHRAAESGRPVDESELDTHLSAAENAESDENRRRVEFLRAVQIVQRGVPGAGWKAFDNALSLPAPSEEGGAQTHLQLMVAWASRLTPPPTVLDAANRLLKETKGTALESPAAGVFARGLLVAERWTKAIEVSELSKDRELLGRALIGAGRAREVKSGEEFPNLRRVEAALLCYDPEMAIDLMINELHDFESAPPEALLFLARARLLKGKTSSVTSVLSSAASGSDHLVAIEARLELGRYFIDSGDPGQALSELGRFPQDAGGGVELRVNALNTLASQAMGGSPPSERVLKNARDRAFDDPLVPPAAFVELELARLELEGPDEIGLGDLTTALERMDNPGTRLVALRGLSRVESPAKPIPPNVESRLRELVKKADDRDEPAIVLGRAQFERLLGHEACGRRILESVLADLLQPPLESFVSQMLQDLRLLTEELRQPLESAVLEMIRDFSGLSDPARSVKSEPRDSALENSEVDPSEAEVRDDTSTQFTLSISSGHGKKSEIRVSIEASHSALRVVGRRQISHDFDDKSHYRLARDTNRFCDDLGRALMADHLQEKWKELIFGQLLKLKLADEVAARIPWELATLHSRQLGEQLGATAIIRITHRKISRPSEEIAAVRSPFVYLKVGTERKDRGHVMEMLRDGYTRAGLSITKGSTEKELRGNPGIVIVHFVAEVTKRRAGAELRLGKERLTALNLAHSLDDHWLDDERPRLMILDLALDHSDTGAAEQLMLANEFCWTLTQEAPNVSAFCGVFAAANDRLPAFETLTKALGEGREFTEIAEILQRPEPSKLLSSGHVLRRAVSAFTADPHQRFNLGT